MAAANVPVTRITNRNTTPLSYTAAHADGNYFSNSVGCILLINNADGDSCIVTIAKQRDAFSKPGVGEFAVADIAVTVAAGAVMPLAIPPNTHNDGNGLAQISVNDTDQVSYAVVKADV